MLGRIGSLLLLTLATLLNPSYMRFVVRPDVQVVLGAAIVAFLVFVDYVAGFIAGLALLVMYNRVYMDMYGITGFDLTMYPMTSLVTSEDLGKIQSNVFDDAKYDKPYTGVQGVYGERVYSAQGLDNEMPGMSVSEANF